MKFPKYNVSNLKGRNGLNILTKIVENELGWILRPNHQENDFGIDAYIDIITNGYITGKSIAIQIKSGESYLKELDNNYWKFNGDLKHLNYYLNQDFPVLIVLIDLKNEIAYWEVCTPEIISMDENKWTIPIPKEQQINQNLKGELLKHVSKEVDYISQLEEYWKTNKSISDSSRIYIIIDQKDIQKINYTPLINLISRICSNKLHLSKFKENIEIIIHGYEEDKRELFQIPEVKLWILNIFNNVPGLSYFLVNDEYGQFLKLFLFSMVKSSMKPFNEEKFQAMFDSEELEPVFNILFSDLNDFTEAFNINIEINKDISKHIEICLVGSKI